MSTVPFTWGFQSVTWNYSERGHGKGAQSLCEADGRPGCPKGKWSANFWGPVWHLVQQRWKNQIKWIEEKDFEEFDKLLPPVLPAVRGILGTHQIFSTTPGEVFDREVRCFCSYPEVCDCFNITQVTMTTDSPVQEVSPVPPSTDDDKGHQDVLEVGRFIIVKYDKKRYVGQIWDIQGEEIQVKLYEIWRRMLSSGLTKKIASTMLVST